MGQLLLQPRTFKENNFRVSGNLKSISIKGVSDTGKVMLSSPNWPNQYPADTDVYYCITASAGRRVNMQFDWMDLETNCGYNCDYVRVRT